MTPHWYTLEEVAEKLRLQVRTVRGYVRSGTLKAKRIGKQYRVTQQDLETLMGPEAAREAIRRQRQVEVSSVVVVDALSAATAERVSNHLVGAAKAPRGDESPLRVEAIYDTERARLKIIVLGSLGAAGDLFKLLHVLLDD